MDLDSRYLTVSVAPYYICMCEHGSEQRDRKRTCVSPELYQLYFSRIFLIGGKIKGCDEKESFMSPHLLRVD